MTSTLSAAFLTLIPLFLSVYAAEPVPVIIPDFPSNKNAVQSNFLGISFELSFMDQYFGNDVSSIPIPIENYLSALSDRTPNSGLRLRVGGNSMDSSTYVPSQTTMIQRSGNSSNADNQVTTYGPELWNVLDKVANKFVGVEYLIGLPLLHPNSTNETAIASAAQMTLGHSLDAFLLGNEPDLYSSHGNRPNLFNYTLDDYIEEYRTVVNEMSKDQALSKSRLGGPTICCNWDLRTVLEGGFLAAFDDVLKYVSLQHYPQNNCFGSHRFDIPYYTLHSNVVELATWQQPGIDLLLSNKSLDRPKLVMDEFNSVSCGGVPGLSDSFAVGSMWIVDYALQLASKGYSAAYVHTRESGVSYNVISPPDGPGGSPGPWTTKSPFYALLVVSEALQSDGGNVVVDLDVDDSQNSPDSTVGGYAIYDALDTTLQQLVLFNFANEMSGPVNFSIPTGHFSEDSRGTTVKYLTAASISETTNIAWGGQTFAGVGDGNLIDTNETWAKLDEDMDCSNGCNIVIPSPGIAVAFVGKETPFVRDSIANADSENGVRRQEFYLVTPLVVSLACLLLSNLSIL